ncbi:hypothetical protein H0O00_05705, partial [Candidatus Micrarchaeota archaeon]|nr:hypothetical protein [Candidatus Micrarchaeota archaeon]
MQRKEAEKQWAQKVETAKTEAAKALEKPEDGNSQQTYINALTPIVAAGVNLAENWLAALKGKKDLHIDNARDAEQKGNQPALAANMESGKETGNAIAELEGKDKNKSQAEFIADVGKGMSAEQQQDILKAAAAVGFSVIAISMAGSMLFGEGKSAGEEVAARNAELIMLELLRDRMMALSRDTSESLEKCQGGKWRT